MTLAVLDASTYILDKSLAAEPTTQINIQTNTISMHAVVAAMPKDEEEREGK